MFAENQSAPKLVQEAAGDVRIDATRLSSSRRAVCCTLSNAFAQRGCKKIQSDCVARCVADAGCTRAESNKPSPAVPRLRLARTLRAKAHAVPRDDVQQSHRTRT